MIAASFATGWPEMASLALAGLATFVAPGAALLAAAAVSLRHDERLACSFAASLALLTATFATCLLLQLSIASAPLVLAVVTVVATIVLRLLLPSAGKSENLYLSPVSQVGAPMLSRVAIVMLAGASVWAAVAFAPVGSVDRWWYLAYVRGYLEMPALATAEPFLGTGQTFARFGVHPWLLGLAMWSWLAGLDPVFVYERGAPVLVVLASISAACALARQLFADGSGARLFVVATMLLWSGSLVPVLARAGEDKVLAASALLPLCFAAFLRASDAEGKASRKSRLAALLLLAFACIATAAVHPLAYAFVLVALLPTAALHALRAPARSRSIALATAILLAVALAPAVSGVVVRDRLHDIGAQLGAPDHPVVRVHEGRDRLLELPSGGFVVTPRLLWHPLALLALAGLALLWPRRPQVRAAVDSPDRTASASGPLRSGTVRWFLATATLVPLAIAFLPPLPSLAGHVIPPWMVYRVLWLLPLAALAALAVQRISSRASHPESVAVLVLLVLGLPMMAGSARERLAEVRARKAAPADEGFRDLVAAIAALPADARIAAAPELSERLPAFAARAMVAGLDRSTVVFAGSRERGEARLRARAALLAGDEDGITLARAAGVTATHAVYNPGANPRPRCAAELLTRGSYALCALERDHGGESASGEFDATAGIGTRIVAQARCEPPSSTQRRDPWSASAPVADCRVDVPPPWRGSDELFVVLRTKTGRAVDELRVAVRGSGIDEKRAVIRTSGDATISLHVGEVRADVLEIRIASSFLPVLRLEQVALVVPENATRPGE